MLLDTVYTITAFTPAIAIIGSLFATIISGDTLPAYYAISVMILDGILNKLLKMLFKRFFGRVKSFQRPNPPKEGCSIVPCKQNCAPGFGMPSGHSQFAFYSATFWALYLWKQRDKIDTWQLYTSIAILYASAIWIASSRVLTGCHNLLQVTVGGLIGTALAYPAFIWYGKINV